MTGRARYSSDIQADGWLYGMILRSKWPAAKITDINLDKALQMPGIKAAVKARDGEFTVRFYGEEIAAVCGTTKQACLDALRAIEVKAQPHCRLSSAKTTPKRTARRWSGKASRMFRRAAPTRTGRRGPGLRRMRRRH